MVLAHLHDTGTMFSWSNRARISPECNKPIAARFAHIPRHLDRDVLTGLIIHRAIDDSQRAGTEPRLDPERAEHLPKHATARKFPIPHHAIVSRRECEKTHDHVSCQLRAHTLRRRAGDCGSDRGDDMTTDNAEAAQTSARGSRESPNSFRCRPAFSSSERYRLHILRLGLPR